MPYQVGNLEAVQEDDPVFEDLVEAQNVALDRSQYRECAQGIWTSQQEGSEIVAIAYQGSLFT